MKKKLFWLLPLLLLSSGTALAQDKGLTPDHIGIYSETDGTGKAQITTSTPMEYVELHLLLIKPSVAAGVSAWECRVNFMPHNVTGVTASLVAGTDLETADPWDFSVEIGTASPLPAADFVHIMTISCYVEDPLGDPVYFYIDGSSINSMGFGIPCYAAGDDSGQWHYLLNSSRAKYLPVFAINGTVVDVAPATWGTVKSLFR